MAAGGASVIIPTTTDFFSVGGDVNMSTSVGVGIGVLRTGLLI